MIPSLKFEGAKELEAALMKLEGVRAKKIVSTAILDALVPIVEAARNRVPVATGALQESIGIGDRLRPRQKSLLEKIAAVEAYVGPGVGSGGHRFYGVSHAHLVEFGTVKVGPRPFMRPAWTARLQDVFDRLAKNMTDALQKFLP